MKDMRIKESSISSNTTIRVVLGRLDEVSYIEGIQDDFNEKRTKHNYVICSLKKENLIELRDALNSLNL